MKIVYILNVWTQAAYSEQPKPVLVYIHGGGFQEGSGSVAVYDGSSLAQKGLVVVTIIIDSGFWDFLPTLISLLTLLTRRPGITVF